MKQNSPTVSPRGDQDEEVHRNKIRRLNQEVNNTTTQQHVFPCEHERWGCVCVFPTRTWRDNHSKRCVFGLISWCKDDTCAQTGQGRGDTLSDLVDHAIEKHSCISMISEKQEALLPIEIQPQLFTPNTNDFCAKIVATVRTKHEGSTYKVVFMALVKEDTDKLLHILPMLYGIQGQVNHLVRMKMTLSNAEQDPIPCHGDLKHPSHKLQNGTEVLCNAIRNPLELFDMLKKETTLTYRLKDVVNTDGPTKLFLQFSWTPYRFHILGNPRNEIPSDFALTWEQVGACADTIKNLLIEEKDFSPNLPLPSAFTSSLLPLLNDDGGNLVLVHKDLLQMINHMLAVVNSGKSEKESSFPTKTNVVILFPALVSLYSIGVEILDKAESVGITALKLDLKNHDIILRCLERSGCDILLTTPAAFTKFVKNKTVENILLPNLKYVLLPDSKFIMFEDTAKDIINCMQVIRKNVIRIALDTSINITSFKLLESSFLGSNVKVVLMGTNTYKEINTIRAMERYTPTINEKLKQCIRIILKEQNWKRVMILGNENLNELLLEIQKKIPSRQHVYLQREEANQLQPTGLQQFKHQPGSILLSPYKALNNDAADYTDVVLMFDETYTKADKVKVLLLATSGKMKDMYFFKM